jgi:uncharacterized protein YndB with AHSA1/START domain
MTQSQSPAVPALIVRRTFKAPRARVFAAWTQTDALRQWFGPPGYTIPEIHADVRVGGTYRITLQGAEGEPFVVGGVFTEITAPERLAFTWRWKEDDPADERDTSVTIDFIDRGAETEILFRHEGFVDDASRGRHDHGWTGTFEKLTGFVERT